MRRPEGGGGGGAGEGENKKFIIGDPEDYDFVEDNNNNEAGPSNITTSTNQVQQMDNAVSTAASPVAGPSNNAPQASACPAPGPTMTVGNVRLQEKNRNKGYENL